MIYFFNFYLWSRAANRYSVDQYIAYYRCQVKMGIPKIGYPGTHINFIEIWVPGYPYLL